MRRSDRALPRAEAEAILQAGQYGILSLTDADGAPYGVPMSYVYQDGRLYFHHTAAESLLTDCVAAGARACFTVVGRTKLLPDKFSTLYESAIAMGPIRESGDKLDGLLRLAARLGPGPGEQSLRYAQASLDKVRVFVMDVEQLTGKARRA